MSICPKLGYRIGLSLSIVKLVFIFVFHDIFINFSKNNALILMNKIRYISVAGIKSESISLMPVQIKATLFFLIFH